MPGEGRVLVGGFFFLGGMGPDVRGLGLKGNGEEGTQFHISSHVSGA